MKYSELFKHTVSDLCIRRDLSFTVMEDTDANLACIKIITEIKQQILLKCYSINGRVIIKASGYLMSFSGDN